MGRPAVRLCRSLFPPSSGCDGLLQTLQTTRSVCFVQSYLYWSGLEYAPNTVSAWGFYVSYGDQNGDFKFNDYYAWAVRPGDVAAAPALSGVPEPGTVGLLALGLLGLGLTRLRG